MANRNSTPIGQLFISVQEGKGFTAEEACTLHCVLKVENQQIQTTASSIASSIQPTWNEGYNFDITTPDARVFVEVYSKTITTITSFTPPRKRLIGTVDVPISIIGLSKGILNNSNNGNNNNNNNNNNSKRSHVWIPLSSSDFPDAQIRCELYYTTLSDKRIGLEHFIILKKLGQGAFGDVFLVRKKDTGGLYAMKVCDQDRIISLDLVDLALAEHNLIKSFNHPFVVSLKFSFKTKRRLYLIMDYIAGGELFYHILEQRIFSEKIVQFYAAQLVLALGFLHEHSIIYRDLKPENLLLDVRGYICICDFGLCKELQISEKAYTMCGSTEYMAPEILKGKGYGKEVDWWALGALIYEMLTGKCLFTGPTTPDIHNNILYGSIPFPDLMSKNAMSLIINLLKKDPTKRLGYGPKDSEDIKSHPFFAGMDWQKLLHKEIEPPFKPMLAGDMDLRYFNPDCTESDPDGPCSSPRVDTYDENFGDFSYVAPAEVFKANQGGQCLRGASSNKLKLDRAHSALLLMSLPHQKPLNISISSDSPQASPRSPLSSSPASASSSPSPRRPFSLPDQVSTSPLHSMKLSQSVTIGHGLSRLILSDREEDIYMPDEEVKRSPRLSLDCSRVTFDDVEDAARETLGINKRDPDRQLAKSMSAVDSAPITETKEAKKPLQRSMKISAFSKLFKKSR